MLHKLSPAALAAAILALGPDCNIFSNMILLGNGKTGKSIESKTGCPMMPRDKSGKFTSPKCPNCYAASLLNMYKGVQGVLFGPEYNTPAEVIELAANSSNKRKLSGHAVLPGERLRAYALTDFVPGNLPMLRALSKVYKLDIISKTLWHFPKCRELLPEIAALPNVNVSLSFNRVLADLRGVHVQAMLDECLNFISDNNIGETTGLNYTFTRQSDGEFEPLHRYYGVGVYHYTSHEKNDLSRVIGDDGVCCIYAEDGSRRKDKDKAKGSCLSCDFCRCNVVRKYKPEIIEERTADVRSHV